MLQLTDKKWKEFVIKNLFIIKSVKGLPIEKYKQGLFPYISTSAENNGLINFVNANLEAISKGKAISVNPISGKAFYHDYDFVGRGFSGASICSLYNEHLNKYSGLFIAQAIENTAKHKASYGNLFNSDRLKNGIILLPTTADNQPDWKFMEQYVKERYNRLVNEYVEYVTPQLAKMHGGGVALNSREWKEFLLLDIFDIRATASSIDKVKLNKTKGIYPYISRSNYNNAIVDFFAQQAKFNKDLGNCITIGLDTQTVHYQAHSFYTGQNIQILRNNKLNKYSAEFFIPLLKNVLTIFNWGSNGATLGRLKKSKIILPVNLQGNPDYEFMESYVKQDMFYSLKTYLEFAKCV